MSRKKINLEDAIDFITGGDLSDVSDLPEESDFEELPGTHFTDDENDSHDLEDEEDDVPISSIQNKKQRNEDLGGDELDDNQNNDATPSKKHKFRWRKKDTLIKWHNFVQPFTEPPFPELTSYQYFQKFFPDEIITDVVEQTNIYSYQKKQKKYQDNRRRDKITDWSYDENRYCFFTFLQMLLVTAAPIFSCSWCYVK